MSAGFTVVLRGFDCEQVDSYLTQVTANPAVLREPVLFDVALRGYDREQVNIYLDRLRAQSLRAGVSQPVMAAPGNTPREAAFRRCGLFRAGYDQVQVDALIGRIKAGSVTAEDIERAQFEMSRKGYDVEDVDSYLEQSAAEVRGRAS